jgi:hypothetical protein
VEPCAISPISRALRCKAVALLDIEKILPNAYSYEGRPRQLPRLVRWAWWRRNAPEALFHVNHPLPLMTG